MIVSTQNSIKIAIHEPIDDCRVQSPCHVYLIKRDTNLGIDVKRDVTSIKLKRHVYSRVLESNKRDTRDLPDHVYHVGCHV